MQKCEFITVSVSKWSSCSRISRTNDEQNRALPGTWGCDSHLFPARQEHLERRAVGHIVFGLNHDVSHDLKHVRDNVQIIYLVIDSSSQWRTNHLTQVTSHPLALS